MESSVEARRVPASQRGVAARSGAPRCGSGAARHGRADVRRRVAPALEQLARTWGDGVRASAPHAARGSLEQHELDLREPIGRQGVRLRSGCPPEPPRLSSRNPIRRMRTPRVRRSRTRRRRGIRASEALGQRCLAADVRARPGAGVRRARRVAPAPAVCRAGPLARTRVARHDARPPGRTREPKSSTWPGPGRASPSPTQRDASASAARALEHPPSSDVDGVRSGRSRSAARPRRRGGAFRARRRRGARRSGPRRPA